MNDKVADKWDEVQTKMKEHDELTIKLSRSLAIQKMWGSPVPEWPVNISVAGSGSKGFYFYLRDASGTQKKFNLEEIPQVLREAPEIAKALENPYVKEQLRERDSKSRIIGKLTKED